ncbi:hydantoinase B/oxoprolinase family protein [Mesorhizobium sp. CO1-1-8]|uniref:hydantoinase B/oxoprolinase family protein n=1 Tax=Mesorhizobium sp. CO1-1-8 TaxID=2876631 RepID=UPI001CD18513|nr:hydantoinase B/oxoprolinase family protein [Mesorhizobium sp. CO1-1-8]MBZ9772208.1 hydantoinase B/oxoprolinase family protein [Mesorhizobium sp. CO1-1-8]
MTAASENSGLPQVDSVSLALFNRRFEGVARKMANTLLRTGRSGVLNIARDFSCCILTADADLLVTNEGLPIHVLSGPDIMARTMVAFSPVLKRGDAFLNNSPYHGCSHAADHTILVPVIDDDGRHRFTVLAKAHQADIGNSIPTTYHGSAKDVYEEGALIFPSVKVQENFETDQDFVRMCRMRIRVPDQWWGDFLAMVGAARIGEQEIMAMAREVGWDTLTSFAANWLDYSERRMVEAIRALPAGTARRSSTHDPFPGTPEEGIVVNVAVEIDPAGARIGVDLTDNIDCLPCGLNLSESCSRTSAMVGIFNSIEHSVPKNAGSLRRIDLKLRENCVVGIPRHPTSTSVATTNVADRVANAVQASIAEIAEGAGMAECGAIIPPAVGVISGMDPKSREPFVNQIFLGMTGGAGSPRADAWMTIGHVGNAGLCNLDSVELDELRQPIHVYSRKLLPNTEGAGKFRGAPSIAVEFGPVGCDIDVGYVSDGMVNAAQGVRGGGVGGGANQFRLLPDGRREQLESCAQVRMRDGERLLSISCGGGGYGSPSERDMDMVAFDVAEGWITPERAEAVYRTKLAADGSPDREATRALRADGNS